MDAWRSARARWCWPPVTRCYWPAVADVGVGGSIAVLVPGLLLVDTGMGLVLAPLASIVLASLAPERAGSASRVMATVQNVGNALGVAVTGVMFFGALHSGYGTAFELAAGQLAILLVGVAALTRLLPRTPSRP